MSLETKIGKEEVVKKDMGKDIKYIIEAPTRMYEGKEIYKKEYFAGECNCGCPCPCVASAGAIIKAATVMVMSFTATSVL